MKKNKKVDKKVQQKPEGKKDDYNKLLADVEKTNPEFTEWIKSKTRRKDG
jgi:hypothetical protein